MPEQKDDAERARQAAGLLNSPMLQEGMAVLHEGYLQALLACKPDDHENRWRYAAAMRGLVTIRKHLEFVLQRGQIARQKIQEIEQPDVWKRAVRGFFTDGPDSV